MDEIGLAAALKAFGISEGNMSESCFQINPPTSEVELFIRKAGSTKRPMRIIPDEKGIVDLDNLDDDIEYDVEINNRVEPKILLHKFTIIKNSTGVNIHSVDTGATLIESLFKMKDDPFSGAVVLGLFTDKNGQKYNLTGKTSNDGKFKVVLPPGTLKNLEARKGEIIVPKRGKVEIPTPVTGGPLRNAKSLIIEVDPSSFSSVVAPDNPNPEVIILGDISGSMGSKMEILKKSFVDILDKSLSKNWKVALAAWDSWVEWFSTSWIHSSQKTVAMKWINDRVCRGGNDMRYAIEDAMRNFPSATDVYVMCDGDISPFVVIGGKTDVDTNVPRPSAPNKESRSTSYNGTSWEAFRKRFPKTHFHFIALGKGSSAEEMQQMAFIGGGDFWEG